jgi:hypothetical protein
MRPWAKYVPLIVNPIHIIRKKAIPLEKEMSLKSLLCPQPGSGRPAFFNTDRVFFLFSFSVLAKE